MFGKNLFARRRSAGQVAAWPGQAGHEPRAHRVSGVDHDDGQTGSTITRRADGRRAVRKNQRHLKRLEFGGEFALALRILTRPTNFDYEVLSFDPAQVPQTHTKAFDVDPARCRFGKRSKQSNSEDLARLLCANRERIEQVVHRGLRKIAAKLTK